MSETEKLAESERNEKKLSATDEEVEAAFDVPSIFCNKVYVTLQPPTMARVSFAEVSTARSEPRVRTAVTLTLNDLVGLRDLIDRMMEGAKQVDLGKAKSDV